MKKNIPILSVLLALMGCASIPKSVETYRESLNFYEVDGNKIAYLDKGLKTGQVIVLLHGLPSSSYLYRNIVEPLVGKGYRVIAPDFLGFGASDKPQDPTAYAFEAHARRTFSLLNHLGIEKANFVVHDMGGMIAWEMLGINPNRFERILILNTTAYAEGFTPPAKMKMLGGFFGGPMSRMMEGSLMGPMTIRQFLGEFTAQPEKLSNDDIDQYWWPVHEGTTTSMRLVAKNFDAIVAKFPRYQTALKSFNGPVVLLWGMEDKVLNYEKISAQFARDLRIPANRASAIENAGHYLQEDQPEVVVNKILELVSISPKK